MTKQVPAWRGESGAFGNCAPSRRESFVQAARHLGRIVCAVCLVLLLDACWPDASVSVRPPFIPVTFTIDSNWHISVSVGASITTFLGTFSVQTGVSAALSSGSTRVLIVRSVNGIKQEDAFDIREHAVVTLCLNGHFEERISSDTVVIDPLSVPSQINLVADSGTGDSCPSDTAPAPVESTPIPAPTETPTPADSAASTAPASRPTADGQSISLSASSWKPVGGAIVVDRANGILEVTYDPTYWGGIFASTDVGCNYSFSGEGRVLAGGGFGMTVWASIDSSGTPHGQSLQYDVGIGGYRDDQLPDGSETGPVQSAPMDNNWHTVSIRVFNGRYAASVDGSFVFGGSMPVQCTHGLFIRLWNSADVEFRDLAVERISSLS